MRRSGHILTSATSALLLALALASVACGGGSGGMGPDGDGQGLILVNFEQSGIDNLPLNQILRFTFSEALDPESVTPAAIQIRKGPSFGLSVAGTLKVEGSIVTFEPSLPGLCDFSDAGFQPDTVYRISMIGFPEEFAIRNAVGQPLDRTTTYELHTRDEDPFQDSDPGVSPTVMSVTPADGSTEVPVMQGNDIVVEFSENIDPCSIDTTTVLLHMTEVGDINTGFLTQPAPLTGKSTYAVTPVNPPQRIPSSISLAQDFESATLTITPDFGEFPDNALLVLRLTFGITDFGGTPLVAETVSFTTENRPPQTGARLLAFDATTPIDETGTTAEVDTSRAPNRAQGYLLFSGDGDNGNNQYMPSLPNSLTSLCVTPLQANDGVKDDFFPGTDVFLDTGGTVNTCPNSVDGSTAVVWEFKSFHIPSGVTVRIKGVNPAIILVQDEVLIESGGRLLARGDGSSGAVQSRGASGTATTTTATVGGKGVAGGGDGGGSPAYSNSAGYGDDGEQGYYTTPGGAIDPEVGDSPGTGGGESNTSGFWGSQSVCNRNLPSGGGGGHATGGGSGTNNGSGSSPVSLDLAVRGAGGGVYGATDSKMRRAEAGSGGGAGGALSHGFAGTPACGPAGAGGAGGGFIDLTCSGDIRIYGMIDAAGGHGGNGPGNPFNPNYTYNPGGGGGGGGSGGGIRLISAGNIILAPTTVLTAAGGAGGAGGTNQGTAAPVNNGGVGGMGRIVLEDGDSVISGLGDASVTPGEGIDGFYRGVFNPSRFSGGGLDTEALTGPVLAGPIPFGGLSPVYLEPVEGDFVAGIPAPASRNLGSTGILMEARGWQMTADGTIDLTAGPTTWVTVGFFADSGAPSSPTWRSSAVYGIPSDITLAPDNPGTLVGLATLNGFAYLQIRLSFYLPISATPLTPGPYVDDLTFRFTYDQ